MKPFTLFTIAIFLSILMGSNVSFSQAIRQGDIVFDLSYGTVGLISEDIELELTTVQFQEGLDGKSRRIGSPSSFIARFEIPFQEIESMLVGYGMFFRSTNEQWKKTVTVLDQSTGQPIDVDREINVQSSAVGVSVISHVYRFNERLDLAIASHIGFGFGINGQKESSLLTDNWLKSKLDLDASMTHFFEYGAYLQASYFPVRRLGFTGKIGYAQRSGWLNAGLQFVI